ncbi:MAG: TetR family transcriptional regulator, partial [Devosiaceae bacterium]|nr:TetR family transcriptional regulator [Devosiaceae bacterium MH13]
MAITDQDPNEKRADLTKRALLDAAIKLFGQKGFENTTIRDLITEADVNLAAINYHFGSKEGLRYAAIDHLACMFEEDGPGEALRQAIKQPIETMSPDEARTAIREVMRGSFIRSTMDEMADAKSRYIQRELIQGGKPTELFFEKVFSLQFGVMRRLVAR